MASFNKVILMGNLTRDPQIRYTPKGTAVAEIGLAVNRTWFDQATNSRKESVTFVDVTLWAREAEIAGEYLSKGRSAMIEGRLELDSWDDKQTGQKRTKLRVVCERLILVGGRAEGAGGGGASRGGAARGGGGGGGGGYRESSGPPPGEESYSPDSFYDSPGGGGGGGGGAPDDEVPF